MRDIFKTNDYGDEVYDDFDDYDDEYYDDYREDADYDFDDNEFYDGI